MLKNHIRIGTIVRLQQYFVTLVLVTILALCAKQMFMVPSQWVMTLTIAIVLTIVCGAIMPEDERGFMSAKPHQLFAEITLCLAILVSIVYNIVMP